MTFFPLRRPGTSRVLGYPEGLLSLDADAMGRLRKELVWTLGPARARAVFTRFGYALGYSSATKRRDSTDDDQQWLAGLTASLGESGLARLEPLTVRVERPSLDFEYVASVPLSFEPWEHLSHLGRASTHTACWTLVGYLSGYATAFLGSEVYFDEESCAIAGNGPCRVRGLAARSWPPDHLERLERLFAEDNVGNELTVVYDELARKNQELARSNAILGAQQDATFDAVLVVDREGEVLSYNQRFVELWRIPAELAARRDDQLLLSFVLEQLQDPRSFLDLVRQLYANPLESRQGDILRFKDGRVVSRSTMPVILRDGEAVARAWLFRDITCQTRLEQELRQSQKMEAVGTLAGGIAHDFNNLLTAIGGYIELAADALPPEHRSREALQVAARAVDRAEGLTRSLLNFSQRRPVAARPMHLGEPVAEVLQILRHTFDPIISIETRLMPDLWPMEGDPGQIAQVITNLCVNARDAMPGGGRLLIEADNRVIGSEGSAGSGRVPGPYAVLSVCDTGVGMTPEVKARAFEPFFTTKEIGKGSGLGLAVVYGIVSQHQGFIECESTPGVGTAFRVYLPRAAGAGTVATAPPPPAGRATVLLVDDEPALRDLGSKVLEAHGFSVLVARDGIDGVEMFRRHQDRIKAVVLDLLMPRCSGRDALIQIKAIAPAVPVVIASGHCPPEQALELVQLGAVATLAKPFKAAELVALVRQALLSAERKSVP